MQNSVSFIGLFAKESYNFIDPVAGRCWAVRETENERDGERKKRERERECWKERERER